MHNLNNKEKLFEILPDYIRGTIEDSEILNSIEEELYINEDFRNKLSEMCKLIDNLDSINLSINSDSYFNNLLPEIHKKIDNREKTNKFFNFNILYRVSKYLIPVIPVILIILIYNISDHFQVSDNSTQLDNDSNKYTENNIDITSSLKNTSKNIDANSNMKFIETESTTSTKKNEESKINLFNYIETFPDDEEIIQYEDYDDNTDADFTELDENAQNSILNTIESENF